MTPFDAILLVVAGVATGVLSAIFGVGGGQVVIPFLVLVVGTSQHVAEGTSLLVIVPTAMVGAWAHSRRGYVSWHATAFLIAGGVVGGIAGALLANLLDGDVLRRIYAIFVLWVAYRFLRPRGRGRPAGDTAQVR